MTSVMLKKQYCIFVYIWNESAAYVPLTQVLISSSSVPLILIRPDVYGPSHYCRVTFCIPVHRSFQSYYWLALASYMSLHCCHWRHYILNWLPHSCITLQWRHCVSGAYDRKNAFRQREVQWSFHLSLCVLCSNKRGRSC